jgi:hypothetical protein
MNGRRQKWSVTSALWRQAECLSYVEFDKGVTMKLYAAFRAATLSVPAAASADYLGKVIDRSIGTIDQAVNGGFFSNWYAGSILNHP